MGEFSCYNIGQMTGWSVRRAVGRTVGIIELVSMIISRRGRKS